MNSDTTYGQAAREPRTREVGGPKISTRMWIVGGALVVLGLVNTLILLRPSGSGSPSRTAFHVFPADSPPVITGYDLVGKDFVNMSLRRPFYTPTTLDSLQKGDILYIEVSGRAIWRQVRDPNSTAYPTYSLGPEGPTAVINGRGAEVPIPRGRVNNPEDLPSGYRRNEFPHQAAPMGALVATVGVVVHDRDGMAVQPDEHLVVGTSRWLRLDGRPSSETQLLFTLNLRWKEVSWQFNEGIFQIITRVYRPRAAS